MTPRHDFAAELGPPPIDAQSLSRKSGAVPIVRPEDRRSDHALAVTTLIIAMPLLGIRFNLGQGVTPGYLISFILIPLWLPALRHYRGAVLVLLAGGMAVVSGLWLTASSSIDHVISSKNLIADSIMVLGVMAGVGTVLWARQVLPLHLIALLFGVGLVATIYLGDLRLATNPWKYAYSVPVTVIALALTRHLQSRFMEILVLMALGAYSALNDSRSMFAILAMTAILLLWQYLPSSRKNAIYKTLLALAAVAVLTYNVAAFLVVDGYLGAHSQARSLEQIRTSGSLLVGGRPELTASLALLEDRPMGFGTGVIATPSDILVAKTGMANINYDPNNGYVEHYMFGDKIELHSVLSDLWAFFGIPGLVVGLAILALLVRVLITMVAHRNGSGLELFVITLTLWNLFFSPLYSSAPTLLMALGVALLRKPGRHEQDFETARRESEGRIRWRAA